MIRGTRWGTLTAWVVVGLGLQVAGVAAQEPGWIVTAGAAQASFAGGLTDSTDDATTYMLTPATAWALSASHPIAGVRLGIGVTYLLSHLGLTGDDLLISDQGIRFQDVEIALLATIPLVPIGDRGADLGLVAGPALGLWSITGQDSRTRLGATGTLQLAVPIAQHWRLLATAGGAVAGSPFNENELPEDFVATTLWRGQIGLALQAAL